MNIVLLNPEELDSDCQITLTGRRARHLLEVLKVQAGDSVRVGALGGPSGHAAVTNVDATSVQLHYTLDTPPQTSQDTLFIAMPRPKVLARCLAHATALGFGRICVFRSRRCVKSHFDSHVLNDEEVRQQLCAGLEQSRRTVLPEFSVFGRFRPFVEDHARALCTSTNCFVADADAPTPLGKAQCERAPITLVLGPEGGLIPYEVERFEQLGFVCVHAGRNPLRVEAALNYVAGQLQLLRELAP